MSIYLNIFIVICAVLGLVFLWTGTDKQKDEQTLLVGTQSGYPPFELLDEKGQIVGFDLDLAELIAEKLSKKLVVKDMEFDSLILALQQQKIDLIMAGLNITPSRKKAIHLVPYTGEQATSLSLLFWKEIPKGVHSLKDIQNMPHAILSVQTGSISDLYLKKFSDLKIKSLHGALEPLMDVKMGKSLANLVESDTAQYLKAKYPDIKILSVPLSEEDQVFGFGIGINKENNDLKDKVEGIIQQLKASGQMGLLEKKWFKKGED